MPSDEEEEEEEPEKQQEEEAEVPPEQQSPSSLQSPFSAPAQPQLSPVITSRYPTRARRPPSRLQIDPQQKSYVLNKANLIVYDNQSQTGELETVFTGELFAGVVVSGVKGPHNYSEAMASPENEQWLEAIAELREASTEEALPFRLVNFDKAASSSASRWRDLQPVGNSMGKPVRERWSDSSAYGPNLPT
ncbi:hypothetical protein TYRP_006217 [Tyrophagus putrescentiae]|nr:hypothetical protein TYRP_006217 [Tyrophagus putrescentiae]